MKKICLFVMTLCMSVSLIACGTSQEESQKDETNIIVDVEEGTFGAVIWNDFKTFIDESLKENKPVDAKAITTMFTTDENIPYMLIQEGLDPEYFAGFKEGFKPEGYVSGSRFAPMIGSIPFVGYVFELKEDTDVEAFMKELKDNSDPAWNICVEADQTVVGAYGRMVLFVMCPKSIEE